jgi:RimJ/RimL family protein N-acetyltransferase
MIVLQHKAFIENNMEPKNFSFKPLLQSDLGRLCIWFNRPHVKEWWNDGLTEVEIKSKYQKRIGSSVIAPFIAYLQDKPIGFIQYYRADQTGDSWRLNEMEGTVGIDQFIGEEDYINRGYGTEMIRQFIAKLFSDSTIKKIIIGVDKNNHRAIRCYEKAGFCFSNEITTPEGLLYIMRI